MGTLTVGRLLEFVSDVSNNMADASARRVHVRVLQDALRGLDRAHDWEHQRLRQRITLDAKVTGSDAISVTQDERVFTLSTGVFLRRYVEEAWDLVLDADTSLVFNLVELSSPTRALSQEGQRWVGTTVSDGDYTLYRTRYTLPKAWKRIYQVGLLREIYELTPALIADFEAYRRTFLSSSGQPWHYTTRGQAIEIWPPPADTDPEYQVEIDYQAHVEVPSDDPDDNALIDWPDELEDVLRAACMVKLLVYLGKNAAFDAGEARRNYAELLARSVANDGGRRPKFDRMRLGTGAAAARGGDLMRRWAREGTVGS